MLSNQDNVRAGYWSVATQKHLKQFAADSVGLGKLGNLNLAGKAGRFLGVIRGNSVINNMNKLEQMANNVGITSMAELVRIILPELEAASDKQVELIKDSTGQITGIAEYVSTNSEVLAISGQFLNNQNPSNVERIAIETMDETKKIPYLQSELYQMLALKGYREEEVALAVALQNQYRLLQTFSKSKSQEPIISNEYVWGPNHKKIAMAVSDLQTQDKQSLKEIIEIIQKTQGYPLEMLSPLAGDMILLAKKTGMINPTTIVSSRGLQKDFGFSPNVLLDADTYNDDILDDVKLLLASIRFGENYTPYSTISDPERFLSKLMSYGDVGPHSANATDYTLLEKKGIVRVVTKTKYNDYTGYSRTGPCLELVRKDVAEQALKIIRNPDYAINMDNDATDISSVMDTGYYFSPEENRIRLGDSPEHIKEVEDHCCRVLRGENY
ncbi:hypothetical protein M6D81_04720 [Paenibacillus sp. J5C_2022]|uniref:hypothetical protein n=1 Tax=Paenibacillus sp. J5C2022 TaxID=2977129 RepID=UPI0021CFDBAD|nr:hypothetical protein [Paenibacillus sp. J5C2022]MCU6708009.1 hypothetical protein [Paenibacillus sp. J5C2022]